MTRNHTPTVKIIGNRFRVSGRFFEAIGHISNGKAHCDECDNPEVNARDIEALVERTPLPAETAARIIQSQVNAQSQTQAPADPAARLSLTDILHMSDHIRRWTFKHLIETTTISRPAAMQMAQAAALRYARELEEFNRNPLREVPE